MVDQPTSISPSPSTSTTLPKLPTLLRPNTKRTLSIFSSSQSFDSPFPSHFNHNTTTTTGLNDGYDYHYDGYDYGYGYGYGDRLDKATSLHLKTKIENDYSHTRTLPKGLLIQQQQNQNQIQIQKNPMVGPIKPGGGGGQVGGNGQVGGKMIQGLGLGLQGGGGGRENKRGMIQGPEDPTASTSQALTTISSSSSSRPPPPTHTPDGQLVQPNQPTLLSTSLIKRKEAERIKPKFHPQWRLARVISGHLGWVRSVAVEPGNKWFATGAGDRVIKIWDLASGELKISLTGHISTVRGLAVSNRHPYLFSCGEDKMVKCWDLEQNKVIRHYHGHLSGVYSLSLHPTLDVLVTAGRDAVARVWDMRTKAPIHVLSGHTATVSEVRCQESDPQVITGSMDSTIRLWDLASGRTQTQLTHHHKSVRSLAIHPTEYSFASGSAGGNNIKKWKCPKGEFVFNFDGHDSIINCLAVNEEGVMFSGGDNGSLTFWDYSTGLPFQTSNDIPQPGSLDAESGIFCSTFDGSGSRLITGCADKTVKIYKEVG